MYGPEFTGNWIVSKHCVLTISQNSLNEVVM
jgi:hypothetical protein